jgi:hemolysin-activating ACP:hemolysin acyltransferase
MAQSVDLYSILYSYSRKNESPAVDVESFIGFLQKYAQRVSAERPEWAGWATDTGPLVWRELNQLQENGKVTLVNKESGQHIFMNLYYAEQVREAYRNPDNDADMPFPDETFLNISIPQDQLKPLDISVDLPAFLKEPQKTALPIIKLVFPDNHGEALALASMIPFDILETSLIKVRNFLLKHGNREYIQHKLAPQLIGKEDHLRELMDQVMTRPLNCINDMKDGREAAFYFWAYFCNQMRRDLTSKKDLLADEYGALQAVYLIEVCSSFFKARAAKAKEIELALKNFELEMEKPPYYFSREAIAKFKDNKGIPLLGRYTQEGLDAYIKKRISEAPTPEELPELFYFRTDDGASWLVKKSKFLPLCGRLFAETRPVVIKVISKRWKKLLLNFMREPAMEEDREFENLVLRYVEEYAPVLIALLQDQRLYLVYEELQRSGKGVPESSKLFHKNELLPLRVLLFIKRKELLSDVKLLLPFWYTIPLISHIIAFFQNLGRKKKKRAQNEDEPSASPQIDGIRKELQNAARESEAHLVPDGHTLDSYLEELSQRWGKLLNKQAKDNLVEDVNALVRDKLRHLLHFQKNINRDTIDKMTGSIMDSSTGLRKINEQNYLFLYVKLYLVKLLIGKAVF